MTELREKGDAHWPADCKGQALPRSGQRMPAAVALPSPPVFAPPPVVIPPTPSAGALSAPRAPAPGPPVRATRDTTPMSASGKPKPKRTPLRKDLGNETSEAQPIPHDPPQREPSDLPRIDPPQPP